MSYLASGKQRGQGAYATPAPRLGMNQLRRLLPHLSAPSSTACHRNFWVVCVVMDMRVKCPLRGRLTWTYGGRATAAAARPRTPLSRACPRCGSTRTIAGR